jgi:UPF0755 protein
MPRNRSSGTRFPKRRFGGAVARAVTALVVLGLLVVAAGGIWLIRFAVTPVELPEGSRLFNVERGLGVSQVARQLEDRGVVDNANAFTALVRVLGKSSDMKAGSYEAAGSITPLRLVEKLTRGEFTQGQIRFIEGWTFRQLREVLDQHPALLHKTKGWTGLEILEALGSEETHPEGLFFPDTYYFAAGTSDLTILQQAYNKMQTTLDATWETRAERLPVKEKYQALILASIVEKETGDPSERKMVAAVFVNRLRKRMRLQTDPTVIYGLGEKFDGNLRKRDLLADQPYNTYTRYGLPPTPIAMPGEAAIKATLRPADTRALYFVAKGDGTHYFSNSLTEHNQAVNRFQR